MELRSGRASMWLIVACAVIVATVVVSRRVIAYRDAQASQSAHAELVRQQGLARSEGIPLTVAEFIPNPPTTDAENAAPLYHEAAQLLIAVDKKSGLWRKFDPYHLDKPEILAAEPAFLAQAAPALAIVKKAAKRTKCDLKLSYTEGGLAFPVFAEFKFLTKVAVGEAELEDHDGHPVQALETVAKTAPMCGHLAQSHILIAGFVNAAMDAIFTRAISDILGRHGRDLGVAEAARRAVAALGPMPNLVRIQEGENLGLLDALGPKNFQYAVGNGADSHTDSDDPSATPEEFAEAKAMKHVTELATRPGVADRWRALEIESTREVVALLKTVGHDWLGSEAAANVICENLTKPTDDAHAWMRFTGSWPWAQALDMFALQLSNRRVLTQAAAALEILSQTGELPTKLPLAGEAARDPLGKGSLHYKHSAGGFTIYGVGPHGIDHGGIPRSQATKGQAYDIVFTYPAKR
ncbi:MAG: hypothetical protein ACYC96_15155 [Fimbriimonadaceae bacterium]